MSDSRTVWVLGAGFSRALGGPLIGDLLRYRNLTTLQALLPSGVYQDMAELTFRARAFCAYGREQGYWDHAEQFLDSLETAAAERDGGAGVFSHARSLFEAMLRNGVRYPARALHDGNRNPPT